MTDSRRTITVTSALPYANGPIHVGHLVEHVQTDIWVRFLKMMGHDCVYVCADDTHGAPVMLHAEKLGIPPEELVANIAVEHQADFRDFYIGHDNYYSTHSDENRQLSEDIYLRLRDAGHIAQRDVAQAFDPEKQMFLADRYIRGGCPRCGAEDQYGDSCEVCGANYAPTELVNPKSVLSGATPVEKSSDHYFVKLADFEAVLQQWIGAGHLQPEVRNKLAEWFEDGLRDWDISRDEPYFGFRIPDTDNKYFYVWLDAPVGYMASFWDWLNQRSDQALSLAEFREQWNAREIFHIIGKDILYFHTLFWPAMLHGADYKMPDGVFGHGFLTVNGQKMSKSRGTFIKARSYLEHLDPEYLRYYFATKMGPGIDDFDFNLDDFAQRVNADLVGKVVNIASRSAGFISKRFDGRLAQQQADDALYRSFTAKSDELADLYEARNFSKAIREIMALADLANQFIDEQKPWVLAKEEGQEQRLHEICTSALNLFRVLMIYLKPVLPAMADKVENFLNAPLDWSTLDAALLDHAINKFKPLMTRVDSDKVAAMVESSKQ